MIDIRQLRSDPQGVAGNLARRGYALDLEAFTALDWVGAAAIVVALVLVRLRTKGDPRLPTPPQATN